MICIFGVEGDQNIPLITELVYHLEIKGVKVKFLSPGLEHPSEEILRKCELIIFLLSRTSSGSSWIQGLLIELVNKREIDRYYIQLDETELPLGFQGLKLSLLPNNIEMVKSTLANFTEK